VEGGSDGEGFGYPSQPAIIAYDHSRSEGGKFVINHLHVPRRAYLEDYSDLAMPPLDALFNPVAERCNLAVVPLAHGRSKIVTANLNRTWQDRHKFATSSMEQKLADRIGVLLTVSPRKSRTPDP